MALQLKHLLVEQQLYTLKRYADGQSSALLFDQMLAPEDCSPPDALPDLNLLECDFECLRLSSRNQILLALVEHRPFAFDMDNDGKLVRYVANFKGGGRQLLPDEAETAKVELSSHAGLHLGPHTEAPYHCSRRSADGLGQQSKHVSIVEFDEHGRFSIRFNDYRFSTTAGASAAAKNAFEKLRYKIRSTTPIQIPLQPTCSLLINNCKTLHCRDTIKDNRRLLIRLFGYSKFAHPIVLNNDPLRVQG
ncbi:MAG: hypothetical protein P4N59_00025 [Negativicutes bacterium]|nr:hypothetical protein [Negativicutes bacterium]